MEEKKELDHGNEFGQSSLKDNLGIVIICAIGFISLIVVIGVQYFNTHQ